MKALYGDELVGINQQVATVAASVLSEPVVAATLAQSRIPFIKKFHNRSRWFGRGVTEQNAYDNRISSTEVWLESGGLPESFILAVTASSMYVIEDKRKDAQLFAGHQRLGEERSALPWHRVSMGVRDSIRRGVRGRTIC
jgi:hypothetical protein